MSVTALNLPSASLPQGSDPIDPGRSRTAPTSFSKLLEQRRVHDPSPAHTLVRPTRTPLSGEQAQAALSEAWTRRFGAPPAKATLAILTAQWSHETGRGESMYNYNFGGIKGTGPSGLSVSQRTREGWGDSQELIVDRFRAYRTASEGAEDYLALLDRRYGSALDAARDGDPAGFVRGLKAGGYFTGNERLYAQSISRLAEQALDQGAGLLGRGGPLEDQPLLLRPASGSPRPSSPSVGVHPQGPVAVFDAYAASAIADEMSRAALRIALSPRARPAEER